MKNLLSSLLHLFYPHVCDHCGTDLTQTESVLCLHCQRHLPVTGFESFPDNPVAKMFWGRVEIRHATAAYYFSGSTALQHLIHQFKYHQRKDIALHLGRQMGLLLLQSGWIYEINCLVPVPLHPKRERNRGYNQSALLAAGIADVTGQPVINNALSRLKHTDSQTKKGRLGRRENVADVFHVNNAPALRNQHVLLIDDVITTGATTRACSEVLQQEKIPVSVCGLAYTGH